jgi:hypothetical protein
MLYGSTAQPCLSSRYLSKLSFKRVRKATATFRRLGELVSPSLRQELEQEYKDRGVFEFKDQTAQVRIFLVLLSIPLLLIFTHLIL